MRMTVHLPQSTLKIIKVQVILLNEITRSLMFARKLNDKSDGGFKFIKNSLLKQFIVQWCQIFGARGEDVHFSKLHSKQRLIAEFDRDYILKVTGITLQEWNDYHGNLKRLRDKFFAHFDLDSTEDYLPNLDHALTIADSYRDWLYDLVNAAINDGQLLKINFVKSANLHKLIRDEFKP